MVKNYYKWNDEMYSKHPTRRAVYHRNPIVRLFEGTRIKYVLKFANIKETDRLLEVGCEEGILLSKCLKAKEVIGLDASKKALEDARKRIKSPKVKFVLADATKKIPFKDNYFDVVICSATLEHIKEEDASKVLNEIRRVLKPTGIFAGSVPYEKVITNMKHFFKMIGVYGLLFKNLEPTTSEWHVSSFDEKSLKKALKTYFKVNKMIVAPFFKIGPEIIFKCSKYTKID